MNALDINELPDEVIMIIGSFLSPDFLSFLRCLGKRFAHLFHLVLIDYKKKLTWSCTYWVEKNSLNLAMATIYPSTRQAVAHQKVFDDSLITTPRHRKFLITRRKKDKTLEEYSMPIILEPSLLQASCNQCYLKFKRKGKTLALESIKMKRFRICPTENVIQTSAIMCL